MTEINPSTDEDSRLVTIELGRTAQPRTEVARLAAGDQVVLDQAATDAVDVLTDDQLIARGEIVVRDDQLCIQITELVEHVNAIA